MSVGKVIEIEYATMSVQYVSNYGTMSTLNARIANKGLLPRAYSAKIKFDLGNGFIEQKVLRGVLLPKSHRTLTGEISNRAYKATIEVGGILGIRTYDVKTIYPS